MIEHRLHRLTPIAHGTGGHTHHRAFLEHDGLRVAYWRCARSAAVTHACPDEPDPWVRWAEKVMARQAQQEAAPKPKGRRCGHRPERVRRYGRNSVCLDCQADRDQRRRIRDRLAREAA